MLDCQASTNNKEGETIHCKYCQETGDTLGSSPTVYWGIQLDQDLLETIISIYPEWFKDSHLNMAESQSVAASGELAPKAGPGGQVPRSPPKAEVDETPIQKTMDRNKESLKVKLMLRRPISQLVDQGIMPPLKTPPAFHEQRQKLERAKMGDLLKNKIQRRPDRQELIQQHILEDSNVDPSLQDRQRQLKKARLVDDLNDRLSHRPGPLELIKGNILKTDEELAQAVREGQISFKKTCEGELRKHPPPMFVFEEDSSSEGQLSPLQDSDQSQVGSVQSVAEGCCPVASPSFVSSVASSLSPLSSVSSPSSVTLSPGAISSLTTTLSSPTAKTSGCMISKAEAKEQSRSRKKSKSKSQPKTRTIKFHEYKGPPNAQKSQPTSSTPVESSYDLLLQQQQLFLQWQLEWQHKYPQIILPASQKSGDLSSSPPQLPNLVNAIASNNVSQPSISSNQTQSTAVLPADRCLSKLEEMKVSDLKAELKKRNLPVSGSKPQLIERLKPYSDTSNSALLNCVSNHSDVSAGGGATSVGVAAACLDSTSQSLTGDETLANVNMDTSMSPSNNSEVNNNTLTTSMTPENSSDGSLGLVTFKTEPGTAANGPDLANFIQPSQQQPGTRPSSVAPMDVDPSTGVGFDAMDVTDAAHQQIVTSSCSAPMQSNVFTTTTVASTVHSASPPPVGIPGQASSNEELLKIKIEELQRELQRECESWQPSEANNDYGFYEILRERSQLQIQQQLQQQQQQQQLQQQQQQQQQLQKQQPQQRQQQRQQQVQLQQLPQKLESVEAQVQLNLKPALQNQQVPTPVDSKMQQRLILQQHLQQKIQQQQQQQQKQQLQQQQQQQPQQQQQVQLHAPVRSVASNPLPNSAKASLAAFLQNQSTPTTSNNIMNTLHQAKPFVKTALGTAAVPPNTVVTNASQQQQPYFLNRVNLNKQHRAGLPNGLNHQRTNSLPLFTTPAKTAVVRTTTDPQFIITKPPPNYDEATKQLNKQQFAQGLLNNMVNPPSGQRSIKSQAVDDVLEILIKNGELPPSAAQDPATPTTPKSLASNPLYTTAPPLTVTSSLTTTLPSLIPVTSAISTTTAPPPPPPPLPPSTSAGLVLKLNHTPVPNLGDVGLGSPDLDVNLDLDGLEAMDISQLTGDVSSLPPTSSADLADSMHMDIDVCEWLDSMMPPPTGLVNTPATSNEADSSDPLLSNSQDPFDLFNLDESDFKTPTDLSTLSWDKVDFAT